MRHAGDLLLPGASTCPSGSAGQQGVKLTANLQPVQGATGSGNAAVRVRLGGTALCYTLTVTGLTNVDKALLREILGNPRAYYVNVHTVSFPNGQVQGTLSR